MKEKTKGDVEVAQQSQSEGIFSEKISRRSFAKLLGAQTLLASAVTLTGCGGGDDDDDPAASSDTDTGTQPLTRAAFVATISDYFDWAHSSEYIDMYKAVQPTFVDVTMGVTAYAKQVETALEESIISNESGYFYPETLITREDAADMYVKAFRIAAATTNPLSGFTDASSISSSKLASVKAIVAAGYMSGTSTTLFAPKGNLTGNEAKKILDVITSAQVAPVHSLCKPGTTAPRRYTTYFCPTPGAQIYITETTDGSEPPNPDTTSTTQTITPMSITNAYYAGATIKYDFTTLGSRQYKFGGLNATEGGIRTVRVKAVAVKSGMKASAVREFSWVIYRPKNSPFEAKLVHAGSATEPKVWRIYNLTESVQANAFYVEGSTRGMLVDALELDVAGGATSYNPGNYNLKTFLDSIATKPYDVLIGHYHGDHSAHMVNFTSAGINCYVSAQCQAELLVQTSAQAINNRWAEAASSAYCKVLTDGQEFPLGNVTCSAWQTPGHTNGLTTLLVHEPGWVYASDMWGCNRPYTSDTTYYGQIKSDLFLSMCQQVLVNYRKKIPSGIITEVTNAHQEAPVGMVCINNFLQSYQNLVDNGISAVKPSIRNGTKGNNGMLNVGDPWRNKNWIALEPGQQVSATALTILSSPTNSTFRPASAPIPVDYNAADGYKKYSVLSNIEISGGDLVGVDLYWGAPQSNGTGTVACKVPNKFDPWTYAYTINVPVANGSITIKPTAMSNKIKSMKVNGNTVAQGASTTVSVSAGTKITIDIVAADGTTSSSYTFTVAKV
ncbi:cadherin-like beta sandwich domain-containing protein [Propionivibrio limicola]|uniref:cadherin-like beta sandwich domain-containing protein n=1 Tax=Propionivibrio limicola TaxID=167645 RepID=UPI0012923524|nr:cadherin-like beta sandwich domain-containing protein [Propionivibrio limicola]